MGAVSHLDVVQRILVQDFDLAAHERLGCGIVLGNNVLAGLGVAAARLRDMNTLAFQLFEFLPMLTVTHVLIIWMARSKLMNRPAAGS